MCDEMANEEKHKRKKNRKLNHCMKKGKKRLSYEWRKQDKLNL